MKFFFLKKFIISLIQPREFETFDQTGKNKFICEVLLHVVGCLVDLFSKKKPRNHPNRRLAST